jgi:hypothetical protein
MSKSYRIRTEVGVDKQINVQLDQDFEQIEILSLKVRSEDVYTRMCADYGVVVGRVFTNGGYGVPNAKVSVFIPITEEDLNNEIIRDLYPYSEINDLNSDGYRYNLLPYQKSHGGHTPTGTFPSKNDILTNPALIEVYDKYYKFTVKTNGSGDYMIMGVPTGTHTLVMDLDLSDIGPFSMGPQDIVRMGRANADELQGATFPSSTDLESLPQIVNLVQTIDVQPFWGQPEVCQIGIVRHDFNLGEVGVTIQPTALFMGSILSNNPDKAVPLGCRPPTEMGDLCNLTTGSGEIIAVRQTIFQDSNGLPILEQAELPQGGKVIDEDGTWLLEVPMNLDYVTTNEFGEQILSNDPSIGVPTKGKYRFKVKYGQPNSIELNETRKGYFLVPNVKEYGWISPSNDPAYISNTNNFSYKQYKSSYYFGIDWSGYTDGFVTQTTLDDRTQEIVNCEDTFYEFVYSKVYTVSGLIDQYFRGLSRGNFIGIKEITDPQCASENNRFPSTDAVRNFDFTFFIVNLFLTIFAPIGLVLIPVLNFLAQFWPIAKYVIVFFLGYWLGSNLALSIASAIGAALSGPPPAWGLIGVNAVWSVIYGAALFFLTTRVAPLLFNFSFKDLKLPMISYPDCEACDCGSSDLLLPEITGNPFNDTQGGSSKIGKYVIYNNVGQSPLFPSYTQNTWGELVGDPNDVDPLGMDPDFYSGNNNKKNQKYQADLAGFRYGLSGVNYVIPPQTTQDSRFNKLAQTPVTYSYTTDKFYVGLDITYSQSMNLANIRERYFEGKNIIQTTVNNSSIPSQPFTDNVMVLLVPQNNWQSGDILTFNDPELINDQNISGQTLNQFGSTTITGSTQTGIVTKNVTYIDVNGVTQTSTVYLNSSATELEYLSQTGVEYLQVIAQIDAKTAQTSLNVGANGLIEKYFLNKQQKLTYVDSSGSLQTLTLNSLKSIGNSWENYNLLFLVRGVDMYTEPQTIKYDLNVLFGKNFGVDSDLIFEGSFRMNIPIQPNSGSGNWYTNYKTPESHVTSYSNSSIFHQPYNFVVSQTQFQPVYTDRLSLYSALDKSALGSYPFVGDQPISNFVNNSYQSGGSVSDNGKNTQIIRFFGNEYQGVIEGGTFIAGSMNVSNYPFIPDVRLYSPAYYQPGIPAQKTAIHTISFDNTVGNAKLILRSDRLPASDVSETTTSDVRTLFILFQNPKFTMYQIQTAGQSSQAITLGGTVGFVGPTISSGLDNNLDRVISSFGCKGMVPLDCYTTSSTGQLEVLSPCAANENPVLVEEGCYDLVSPDAEGSYIRNIPILIRNFLEWLQRFRVMFGACRGVFSHVFVNSWVNGTLFAYPFRNRPAFDSNGKLVTREVINNNVVYTYCSDLLYFDSNTNNFYYRSSPFNTTTQKFTGKKSPNQTGTPLGIISGLSQPILNSYNLQYPTTIMDLGPKYFWTKDVILSENYHGYTSDKLNSSSWNEIGNIFQIFVISRLINSNFWNRVLSSGNASIRGFFSRDMDRVDGDYAQMVQINSQYGVKPFNEGNYIDDPAIPGDNPIYISKDASGDPVFGIFYDSYQADRDLITPRRIDRNLTGSSIIADYLGTKSQNVPFYLWRNNAYSSSFSQVFGGCICETYTINNTANNTVDNVVYQDCNSGNNISLSVAAQQSITICACQSSVVVQQSVVTSNGICVPPPPPPADNSIFGNEFNNWYSVPSQPIFSTKYQNLDRLSIPYFIGVNGQIENRMGYIFQRNAQGEYEPTNLGGNNQKTLQGAPWYFYFGLRSGASAIDKFRQIYIGTDE